jgi:NodT family efflux transporter outer membrane factor (OMF) lipoprotein
MTVFSPLPMPVFSCAAVRRLYCSVVALTMLLAGCAVGPEFTPPVAAAPAGWSAWHSGNASLRVPELEGSQASASEHWWTCFNDATLNLLQQKAQAASPDLQSAALRFAQSRVQRQTTAAQRGPQIAFGAAASRQRQSETGAATRVAEVLAPASRSDLVQLLSEPYSLYQGGFDASWEIDLWGRVRRVLEAADADVAAANAALDGVRLGIAAEVARNYFELRGLQQQLRLARSDLAASEEHLELMQARVAGGMASELEASRQRSQLAELRSRLPSLLEQEAAALSRLSLLLGQRPGSLQAVLAADADREAEAFAARALPELMLGVPSELARRRPDIRQAEARLHSITASIGVAVADLYPRITLGGNFGFESTASGTLGDWGSRRWSIGPSLDLPIFDMGRRRSVVALRQLQQQEAAIAYQQTVLRSWHEIDTALSSYRAQYQRRQQLEQRERESRDTLQLAQARSRKGLSSMLDELEARRAMLAAQRDAADSHAQLAIRLVAVFKALGGGAGAGSAGVRDAN